jgi:hypothetical protein
VRTVLDVAGRVGQVMLGVGAVLVLAGAARTLPQALRVRRRALALRGNVLAARSEVEAGLRKLAAEHDETEALLLPWRRLWRWARHPLVVALLEWSLRRRRRSSAARAGPLPRETPPP